MKTYFRQVIPSFRYGVIIIFMLLTVIILLSGCQDIRSDRIYKSTTTDLVGGLGRELKVHAFFICSLYNI